MYAPTGVYNGVYKHACFICICIYVVFTYVFFMDVCTYVVYMFHACRLYVHMYSCICGINVRYMYLRRWYVYIIIYVLFVYVLTYGVSRNCGHQWFCCDGTRRYMSDYEAMI